MTYHPAHSGMLIVLLSLTSLALGSLTGRPAGWAGKANAAVTSVVGKQVVQTAE